MGLAGVGGKLAFQGRPCQPAPAIGMRSTPTGNDTRLGSVRKRIVRQRGGPVLEPPLALHAAFQGGMRGQP